MNFRHLAAAWMCLGVAACSGGGTSGTYSIGGTVSGLNGTLVLADNVSDHLTVTQNGTFTFTKTVGSGATYSVSVNAQPTGQVCKVSGGTGVVTSKSITSVSVACTNGTGTEYSVGGTVSGFDNSVGDLVLANGTDQVTITASGAFAFPTSVNYGAAYDVTISAEPGGWNCSVQNANGAVQNANVTNVAVSCTRPSYTISGNISGATGPFTLSNNGTPLQIAANQTSYSFTGLHQGDSYDISVASAPTNEGCTVLNPTGTIESASITGVKVTCGKLNYTISGTITGQSDTVQISDGTNTAFIAQNQTAFTFTGHVTGDSYTIAVQNNPAGQSCSVGATNSTGTVGTQNISGIVITCNQVPVYALGGTVQNANGSVILTNSVVVQNSSGSTTSTSQTVPAGTTSFSFGGIETGASYTVSVAAAPAGQFCSVSQAAGTMGNANINSVVVSCQTACVSGSITGVSDNLILSVTNGGVASQAGFNASASTFAFCGYVPGDSYSVSVYASSRTSSCSFTSNSPGISGSQPYTSVSGTIGAAQNANVTGVTIDCAPATYSVGGRVLGENPSVTFSVSGQSNNQSLTYTSTNQYFAVPGFSSGDTVTISITHQPASQTCTVSPPGPFTLVDSNLTGININCQ